MVSPLAHRGTVFFERPGGGTPTPPLPWQKKTQYAQEVRTMKQLKAVRKQAGELVETENFLKDNYISLKKFCKTKYNGNGEDVAHEAAMIALQRYGQGRIGFQLFTKLVREAARNLKIHEIQTDQAGNYCIQTPREEKTRTRAAEFFNAPDTLETEINDLDEKIGLNTWQKTKLLKQIEELKQKKIDDEKIIEIMKRRIELDLKQLPLFEELEVENE